MHVVYGRRLKGRPGVAASLTVGLIATLFVQFGARAAPPPPPQPPLGWQANITEGFDPPIERVLVRDWNAHGEDLDAYVDKWGKEAFDVLKRLWSDEKWHEHRRHILRFMHAVDAERAVDFAKARFETYAAKEALDSTQRRGFYVLINSLEQHAPEVVQRLAEDHVVDAAPAVQDVLVDQALDVRPTKRTLKILKQVADKAESQRRREDLEGRRERIAGFVRAQTPMDAAPGTEEGK